MYLRPFPRHQLSKSTFMYGVQCAKRVWLHKNLPKEKDVQTSFQSRIFQQGTDVGALAQKLFPGGVNAEPENYYSYQKSVEDTARYIRRGHQIIYEAAFQYEGILCAIDILVNINSKWYAYEVKSTNGVKDAHIYDAAFQYFVIQNSGLDLEDFSIIHLNKNYVRDGALNISQLFKPASVLQKVKELTPFISSKSTELIEVLSKKSPPDISIGAHCTIPYACDFQGFCRNGSLQTDNIVYEDLVNRDILKPLIYKMHFPVSYLSLQTWISAVPLFNGHSPYKQNCFQYSLHKQNISGSYLEHFNFLEKGMNTQKYELLKSLLNAAGTKGTIVSYYNSFLIYQLQELKKEFNELETEISNLQSRVIELPFPFGVDFRIEEVNGPLHESENDPDNTNNEKNLFTVNDASSAAAAYFNLREETNLSKIVAVREALNLYIETSSLNLVKLIRRFGEENIRST